MRSRRFSWSCTGLLALMLAVLASSTARAQDLKSFEQKITTKVLPKGLTLIVCHKAAIEKVSLADIDAAAEKYIHPASLAVLVAGNQPQIKPGLDALDLGPIHPIDIAIPGTGGPGGASAGAENQP